MRTHDERAYTRGRSARKIHWRREPDSNDRFLVFNNLVMYDQQCPCANVPDTDRMFWDVPQPDVYRQRGCQGRMNSQLRIQFIEQGLCFFQIGCIEAFGEPAINGREEVNCFGPPALFAP